MTIQEMESIIRVAYGFGDLRAPYWFIGLEPGMSRTKHKNRKTIIANRMSAWQGHEIEDLYEYHSRINVDRWFGPDAKLQRTWAKLIRMLMKLDAKPVNTDSLRRFQSDTWGRANSRTCLLELFPLPCPSTRENDWKSCCDIERGEYEDRCNKLRIPRFQDWIREYRPQVVICYGVTKMKEWELVAGIDLGTPNRDFFMKVKNETLFAVIRHPAHIGITNKYFEDVGKDIRRHLMRMKG